MLRISNLTIASSCDAHRSVRLQLFLRCFELFENTYRNVLRGFPSCCQHFLPVKFGREQIVVWCINTYYFPYSYDMLCWKFCNTSTTFPNFSIVRQRSISLDVPLVTCVLYSTNSSNIKESSNGRSRLSKEIEKGSAVLPTCNPRSGSKHFLHVPHAGGVLLPLPRAAGWSGMMYR